MLQDRYRIYGYTSFNAQQCLALAFLMAEALESKRHPVRDASGAASLGWLLAGEAQTGRRRKVSLSQPPTLPEVNQKATAGLCLNGPIMSSMSIL